MSKSSQGIFKFDGYCDRRDGDVMMVIYLEHGNGADKSKGAGEHGASGGTRSGSERARTIIGGLDRNTQIEFRRAGRLLEGTRLTFA